MRIASVMEPVTVLALLGLGLLINRWKASADNAGSISKDDKTTSVEGRRQNCLSRVLSAGMIKFPFLIEVWYWALIYWVYQLGRAATAVFVMGSQKEDAEKHAIQLINIEKKLHIFVELAIQGAFLRKKGWIEVISFIYSYIHIPGTILFLVLLYHFTITRAMQTVGVTTSKRSAAIQLYQSRRRTMALCNVIAFAIFTVWPCMPPRLLEDYGFVDTTHSKQGIKSVWTNNRFQNQYAAMPSLHFGYSSLIGMTIATFPLSLGLRADSASYLPLYQAEGAPPPKRRMTFPSKMRILLVLLGFSYPALILVAIISTANHFILDAVVGGIVCIIAWRFNRIMTYLCPLEDRFFRLINVRRISLDVS